MIALVLLGIVLYVIVSVLYFGAFFYHLPETPSKKRVIFEVLLCPPIFILWFFLGLVKKNDH